MKIITIIIITCLLFFLTCYLGTGSDQKNIKSYALYPNSIQKMISSNEQLNVFDFIIIDMLWWRNSKRVRFSGTENMIEEYKDSKKHFISFVKGIFLFLIVAIIDGILLVII